MPSEAQKKSWKKYYYGVGKEKHLARVRRNNAAYRDWVRSLKDGKDCKRCGEDDPVCLDFHHLNPSIKEFEINIGVRKHYGKERIVKEIEKCSILCANCHRKEHARIAQRSERHSCKVDVEGSTPSTGLRAAGLGT